MDLRENETESEGDQRSLFFFATNVLFKGFMQSLQQVLHLFDRINKLLTFLLLFLLCSCFLSDRHCLTIGDCLRFVVVVRGLCDLFLLRGRRWLRTTCVDDDHAPNALSELLFDVMNE